MLPATVVRIALYLQYHSDFQVLSAVQVLEALVSGLRFDISMAMVMIGLPLMFLHLPYRWSQHAYWHGVWHWSIYLALLVFVFMMLIDFIYFGNVHRHVGSEINTVSQDMDSMVALALRQYLWPLLLFAVGALVGAWGWLRLWLAPSPWHSSLWWRIVYVPLVLFVMLVVARGGVGGKPISVGEAFFSDQPAQGYLALNGAFAMSRAFLESPPPLKTFMPQEEAVAEVQRHLAGTEAVFGAPDYPLLQTRRVPPRPSQPNVVVLMLESWGAQHIDALRTQTQAQPLGITPNFDALARRGRLYSRFYANGQRSILGAESILASQPTFSGMPFLGEGIEQNRQSFMGELARSQGYDTYFLQSSERGSLRFDAIAARTGFGTYRGAEDIPNLHAQPKAANTWGTWDHNTLQAAHALFAQARKPFLGFVFTSSTHAPWLIPDEKFKKFTGGSDKEAFLNSLLYADWALGELIAAAKKAGYFDNTVFVLVADHADEFVENAQHVPNLYQVPLLIVGPGVVPGVDLRLGSQFDILPTLIALCGWQVDYAGFGRSLLEEGRDEDRASLGLRGNDLDWITTRGWVSHNLERSLGHSADLTGPEVAQMQRRLLATYQVASQLQSSNRILPATR
ncbi:MAG: LTA synthase family protein [Rhodoferax sp.]|nr:LTA synthase family protein [Rhodoferax sp.]